MHSSVRVLVVGHTESAAMQLQRRLAGVGVQFAATATATVESATEGLTNATTTPDAIFFRCDDLNGRDTGAVARLRGLTKSEIVAVGSAADSRRVLQLIRAGASDVLHDAEGFDQELNAIWSRLKEKTGEGASHGNLISVVSAGGGCGASTVALNLAAALAKQKLTTGLIDLRLHGGDLATMLNVQPQHTLPDLCQQGDDLDSEMLSKSMIAHPCGVRLLAGPPILAERGPVRTEAVERILQMALGTFSHVIVDLEDVFHREQLATFNASHVVMVVLRLEFPCLVRARWMLEFLEHEGVPRDRLQLVANRYGQKNELPAKRVLEALGQPIAHYLPEDYATAALSANVGNPIVSEAPTSRLANAFGKMAESFVKS